MELHPQIYKGTPIFKNIHLIVCRHCLEHIHHPHAFLISLWSLLNENPKALIFFETPRLEWILENQTAFDFFYEHCNYFTKSSISALFSRARMEITDILPSFNAQYQLIFAKYNPPNENRFLETAFQNLENRLKKYKNLAIWGCGAKGVTLSNTLPNVVCVIDLNKKKQNAFVPSCALPILSPQEAFSRFPIDAILISNPNYFNEIKEILKELQEEKTPLEIA